MHRVPMDPRFREDDRKKPFFDTLLRGNGGYELFIILLLGMNGRRRVALVVFERPGPQLRTFIRNKICPLLQAVF